MSKVETLIIGASRSGTTTLYEYLDKHPQICFSEVKELHFFSFPDLYDRGLKYYHHFIRNQKENQKVVSSSTYLLIDKNAPDLIRNYNPEMKIIIILREPVGRAYSGYQYAINNGYEKEQTSFIQHINNETEIIEKNDIIEINNLCNLYQSKYYEHIKYWENFFPKENFLLLKTSDFKDDKNKLFKQLGDFLNIDSEKFSTDEIKVNQSAAAKYKWLQQILVNRNHPVTSFFRKIIPQKFKYKIINSRIIEKISKTNRKQIEYKPLTEKEKQFANNLLKESNEMLKTHYNIDFEN